MVDPAYDDSPLNDPDYQPLHPPIPGKGVPEIVGRWSAATQVRWFTRFREELRAMRLPEDWGRWYVESVEHKGGCCGTCQGDDNREWPDGPQCCCHSELAKARLARSPYTGTRPVNLVTGKITGHRCDNPVTKIVEGYRPTDTYHGSLDRVVRTCDEHEQTARTKWLRGLNPYSLPTSDLDTINRYGPCGLISDYEGQLVAGEEPA